MALFGKLFDKKKSKKIGPKDIIGALGSVGKSLSKSRGEKSSKEDQAAAGRALRTSGGRGSSGRGDSGGGSSSRRASLPDLADRVAQRPGTSPKSAGGGATPRSAAGGLTSSPRQGTSPLGGLEGPSLEGGFAHPTLSQRLVRPSLPTGFASPEQSGGGPPLGLPGGGVARPPSPGGASPFSAPGGGARSPLSGGSAAPPSQPGQGLGRPPPSGFAPGGAQQGPPQPQGPIGATPTGGAPPAILGLLQQLGGPGGGNFLSQLGARNRGGAQSPFAGGGRSAPGGSSGGASGGPLGSGQTPPFIQGAGLQTTDNQFGVPNDLWQALLNQESRGRQFDPSGRPVTSSAGALGAAQVMPGTAPEAARLAGLPLDYNRLSNDRAYNEALGRAYLGRQLQDFGGDRTQALAAYNAGPARVRSAFGRGGGGFDSLPGETRNYVRTILGNLGPGAAQAGPSGPFAQGPPGGGVQGDRELSRDPPVGTDPEAHREASWRSMVRNVAGQPGMTDDRLFRVMHMVKPFIDSDDRVAQRNFDNDLKERRENRGERREDRLEGREQSREESEQSKLELAKAREDLAKQREEFRETMEKNRQEFRQKQFEAQQASQKSKHEMDVMRLGMTADRQERAERRKLLEDEMRTEQKDLDLSLRALSEHGILDDKQRKEFLDRNAANAAEIRKKLDALDSHSDKPSERKFPPLGRKRAVVKGPEGERLTPPDRRGGPQPSIRKPEVTRYWDGDAAPADFPTARRAPNGHWYVEKDGLFYPVLKDKEK